MADAAADAILRHIRGLAAAGHADRRGDGAMLRAFAATKDQAAFAALVRRHGPMVLGAPLRRYLPCNTKMPSSCWTSRPWTSWRS